MGQLDELEKLKEKCNLDFAADEEPVKCKGCVGGSPCDHHVDNPITKCEAPPEAEYPKEISTIAADNGYLFKIGCQYFVCEGDADKATNALRRYLTLDPSVAREYSNKFDRQDMLYLDERRDEIPLEYGIPTQPSPVFGILKIKPPHISIYNAVNGTVTLDHLARTATVKQGVLSK